MPRREVELEFQPVQLHPDRPRRFAHDRPLRLGQPLEAPRRHVIALQNRPRREQFLQHRKDHPFALIHAERRRLQHQHVLVFVHDQAAEQIPSEFTTRNDVAPGMYRVRSASAARMRSAKNFSFTSTRSGASIRTAILDFEL